MWSKYRNKLAPAVLVFIVVAVGVWILLGNRARRKEVAKFNAEERLDNSKLEDPSASNGTLGRATGALQTAASGPLYSLKHWVAEFVGDDAEAAELRNKIAELQEDKTRLIGVLQENERLRSMLQLRTERPELDLVWGKVIACDITPFFRVLRIRIQLSRPAVVKPLMPVIVQSGVVGVVSRVEGDYAEVMLASDPRSRIDVVSQRNRARGMVEGLGHSADYKAKVAYVKREDQVRKGDLFVTSGKGGVFPQNLQVGRVVEVNSATHGLFQEVEIEPSVDISRLEEVFVVVGPVSQPVKVAPTTMPKNDEKSTTSNDNDKSKLNIGANQETKNPVRETP